jgi:hypothetical protein
MYISEHSTRHLLNSGYVIHFRNNLDVYELSSRDNEYCLSDITRQKPEVTLPFDQLYRGYILESVFHPSDPNPPQYLSRASLGYSG